MTKRRQKVLRKAAVSGVASAVLLAGLTDAASAATMVSVSNVAKQDVTINVAIAYPAPPKAALAAFTKSMI